jgi:putative proteasome-type protease
MRLNAGLVFLSDSRTNAGVDQVGTFRKMTVFERPGERLMVLLTSGNLGVSQSVRQMVMEHPEQGASVWNAPTMYDAATLVGEAVRKVYDRDAAHLKELGVEFNCTLIFGGQIGNERCRLFQIYSAGNFIEAQEENLYFQIGESKYGKPIIDRVVAPETSLDEAAKCALISMDSTLRSNLSVGLPLDMLCYETGALRLTRFVTIDADNEYFQMIRRNWGQRLKQVFSELPEPSWHTQPAAGRSTQPVRAPVPPAAGRAPRPVGDVQAFAQSPESSNPGGPKG